MYRDLSPQGPFNLDVGKLTISKTAPDDMLVEFEGQADVKVCDVRLSGAGVELSGLAKAEGSYSTKRGSRQGRVGLAAERLVIKGRTVSNMTVDAVYDPNARMWSADGFLGDCYEGKVLGTLHVGRTEAGALGYMLQVALNRVDLQRFLLAGKPAADEKPYSGGVMNAFVEPGRPHRGCGVAARGLPGRHHEHAGRKGLAAVQSAVGAEPERADGLHFRTDADRLVHQAGHVADSQLDMSGRNVAFTGSGYDDAARRRFEPRC